MDDMGTPGPNHPAHRGLKDKRSESQFSNVFDLHEGRVSKALTGKAKAVPVNPDELADLDKHWESGVRE